MIGLTNSAAVLAQATSRGETAGADAVVRVSVVLAERAAAEFRDVAVTAEADAVVLRAPGLTARAFGNRRRAADPRLAGLLTLAIAMGNRA